MSTVQAQQLPLLFCDVCGSWIMESELVVWPEFRDGTLVGPSHYSHYIGARSTITHSSGNVLLRLRGPFTWHEIYTTALPFDRSLPDADD